MATLDYDRLGELCEVRDGGGAGRAPRGPPRIAHRDRPLKDLVEQDRTCIEDIAALAQSNKVFHRQLHRASHNRYLAQTLAAMRRSLLLLSGTTLASPGRGAESVEEHAAIAARDEDAAEAAARRHIVNALRTRLRLEAKP